MDEIDKDLVIKDSNQWSKTPSVKKVVDQNIKYDFDYIKRSR